MLRPERGEGVAPSCCRSSPAPRWWWELRCPFHGAAPKAQAVDLLHVAGLWCSDSFRSDVLSSVTRPALCRYISDNSRSRPRRWFHRAASWPPCGWPPAAKTQETMNSGLLFVTRRCLLGWPAVDGTMLRQCDTGCQASCISTHKRRPRTAQYLYVNSTFRNDQRKAHEYRSWTQIARSWTDDHPSKVISPK